MNCGASNGRSILPHDLREVSPASEVVHVGGVYTIFGEVGHLAVVHGVRDHVRHAACIIGISGTNVLAVASTTSLAVMIGQSSIRTN